MTSPPWLLVSGDFTTWGGMDRANYELAWHLAERLGVETHVASHFVAPPLAGHPKVTWHRVAKPFGRYSLSEPLLSWRGRKLAAGLSDRGVRVVVNGGNCPWGDVNWVHYVHAAWTPRVAHVPFLPRTRLNWAARRGRAKELRALSSARLVLANSQLTHRQVSELGVPEERIRTVYYGIDPDEFRPTTPAERAAARAALGWAVERPVAVFVGALGHDRRKGFDALFAAWEELSRDATWDCDLVAVGGGVDVEHWRARAVALGLSDRIRMLGFSKEVPRLLAAADLLVSPTYYEAYGLGVHEALCRGLPALVTRSAGVAERYPAELSDLLVDDPPAAADLAARLRRWRADLAGFRARVAPLSDELRRRTWTNMAEDIVDLVQKTPRKISA
jgi:glycosyltransferase involved in cell wall biosynthesis